MPGSFAFSSYSLDGSAIASIYEAHGDRVSGGSQVLRPALRSFPVPTIAGRAGRDPEAAERDLSVGVDHVGILLPAVGGDPWGRLHCLGLAGFEIYEPHPCVGAP